MAVQSQQSPYISLTSKMPCKTIATFKKKKEQPKINIEIITYSSDNKLEAKRYGYCNECKHKQQKDGFMVLWFYRLLVYWSTGLPVWFIRR